MDNVVPENRIADTFCEQQCIGVGDHHCGDVHALAVYIIGMYKTTLVPVNYCNIESKLLFCKRYK